MKIFLMPHEEKCACEVMANWFMNAEINKGQWQGSICKVYFVHESQNSNTLSDLTVTSFLPSHLFLVMNLWKHL